MVRSLLVGSLVVLSTLVIACGASSSDREGFKNGPDTTSGGVNNGDLGNKPTPDQPAASEECQKMDIVFVVDDSGSMKEEQSNLAANFPKFVDKINTFKTKSGSKLDWRLAVTTTGRNVKYKVQMPFGGPMSMDDKGDDGAFRMSSSCGTKKRWVEKADSKATDEFSCLAQAGTNGSSLEMPLLAAKMALTDRVNDGTNQGFLREDALLAIVILTDEDDCSREDSDFTLPMTAGDCSTMENVKPVADYKQLLDGVTKGAGRWATAVIAGQTSCKSSFGDAAEAKRLKEFVGMAGNNGTFSSICDGDLSAGLEKALDTFDAACKALPPRDVK